MPRKKSDFVEGKFEIVACYARNGTRDGEIIFAWRGKVTVITSTMVAFSAAFSRAPVNTPRHGQAKMFATIFVRWLDREREKK